MSQISQSWRAIYEPDTLLHQILCLQGPDARIAEFTSLTFLNFLLFDLSVEVFALSLLYTIYLYGFMDLV